MSCYEYDYTAMICKYIIIFIYLIKIKNEIYYIIFCMIKLFVFII